MGEYTIDNPDLSPNALQTQAQAFAKPAQASVDFANDSTATAVASINGQRGDVNINPAAVVAGFETTVTVGASVISVGVKVTPTAGFTVWSGASDKTSHATYPVTTASAAYVQAESQGLMDKMQQITEAYRAVEQALIAHNILGP